MKRVRFAPSPTGYLHIGGARTCLFNWLYAKEINGEFILRIEDTDLERSKKEYLDEILESIKWLGIDWDKIYYQSQRFDIYQEYAEKLIKENKAYRKDGAVFFKYNFKSVKINDLIRGEIIFNELPKDEEVIIKSNNSPTYNFCCCVDDALMEVSCVVRGEDHISNTPKQILMYQALGFPEPEFAHLPLILSPQGGRLSKRFGATSIREYKNQGYLSVAITNYLLLLGWSPGHNREIVSLSEAAECFKIKNVNKTGAAFSIEKMDWVNSEYIKSKDLKELSCLAADFLKEKGFLPENVSKDYFEKVIGLFKDRIKKLNDLLDSAYFCFYDDYKYGDNALSVLDKDLTKEVGVLIEKLSLIDDFSSQVIEKEFRETVLNLGLKVRDLVHPVRVALTGEKVGPGLFETMEVLEKQRVLLRLRKLIDYWKGGCNG